MRHAWGLFLIAAAGCVDLKAGYPDRRFYTVEAARPEVARQAGGSTVLRVRRFSASKMCDGSELVTRTGEAVYETDFYNVLFMPPAADLGEQSQRWLAASGLFAHVVGSGSTIPETHVLEGNVISLYGDYRKPETPVAVIEVQFMLVRVTGDPPSVLLQKSYRKETALSDGRPPSLVKGWGEGLGGILSALEEDLSKK